jgi:hypothetical protein
MADLSSEVQFRITQTGAKELSQSLVDVDGKMKQVGQSTSNLTKFIREQRTENRQQNFLFKESRDVIGSLTFATIALTSATGSSSKEVQKMNQVLTTGFSAFQATNFAMSALGIATGGVSTAIQAVVGSGVALLSFLNFSNEAAKKAAEEGLKKYEERLKGISLLGGRQEVGSKKTEIAGLEKLIKKYGDLSRTEGYSLGSIFVVTKAKKELTAEEERALDVARRRLPNARAELLVAEATQETYIKQFDTTIGLINKQKLLVSELEKQVGEATTLQMINERTGDLVLASLNLNRIEHGLTTRTKQEQLAIEGKELEFYLKIHETIVDINIQLGKKPPRVVPKDTGEILPSIEKNAAAFAQIQSLASMTSSNIFSFFKGDVEGIAGLFDGLTQSIVDSFARLASELAAKGLLSLILSLLGGGSVGGIFSILTGGLFAGAGGASPSGPTTINVNQSFSAFDGQGLRRTFNKPEVRNAITSAISDAARKGKI